MGRKPTIHLNLPPGMRKRIRSNNRVYYFLDTGAKPRKEISLGTDYMAALIKYGELNTEVAPVKIVLFADLALKYEHEALPKLAPNTIRTQRSDIKHVIAFFKDAPLDEIKPKHIKQFLQRHKDKPTTANRCKRLFSTMWNQARGWGYTDLPNPCEGIKGHKLGKRTVYITDDLFALVHSHASVPLQDALDLAYLTGQRPADALAMTEKHIQDGYLTVRQEKTNKPLRITITGKLAELIDRIHARKKTYNIATGALLVNLQGKKLTYDVLKNHFAKAKEEAIKAAPESAEAIEEFWFYDLRAKAADDTSDQRGELEASHLLGHDNVQTTKRHYLRRGKIVTPTK